MSTEVRWRRGTTAEHASFAGALGEITVDTTKKTVVVHDGTTLGGFPVTGGGGSVNIPTVTVKTLSELRGVDKTKSKMVMVYGHSAVNDGGGGAYYLDDGDTTSTDTNGLVVVGTDGGRWKLRHDGVVFPEQVGAFSGSGMFSTVNVQRALDDPRVRVLQFKNGEYYIIGPLKIPANKTVRGISTSQSFINGYGSSNLFTMTNGGTLENLQIQCLGMTAGSVVLLDTATSSMEYVTVQNITVRNAFGVVTDSKHATNVATNVRIRNVHSRLTKGIGFDFRNVFAFLEMRDCAVDHVGNPTAVNQPGYRIVNNQGSYFVNCEFTGSSGITSGTTTAQIGFQFETSQAIYLQRCFGDVAGGHGFNFETCEYIRMAQCTSSLSNNHGVRFNTCKKVNITDLYVGGRKGQVGANPSISGILIYASTDVIVSGAEVHSCTGNGFYLLQAGVNTVVSNVNSHDNTLYGYVADASAAPTLGHGCNMRANGSGGHTIGASDQLRTSMNNGAYLNVGSGT